MLHITGDMYNKSLTSYKNCFICDKDNKGNTKVYVIECDGDSTRSVRDAK